MTNMKSIRKCDDKVTASDLGVKEGDKFVVIPLSERYNGERCSCYSTNGDILILKYDDNSSCPKFFNQSTQESYYESFSCLARYEDYYKQQEKETEMKQSNDVVLENVKFDMKAIAKELDVPLEAAHYIVQNALFAEGVTWASGHDAVKNTNAPFLTVEEGRLKFAMSSTPQFKQLSIKQQLTFYVKEQPKEVVEFGGKKYNKEDLEKALALLSPVSE